MSMSTIRQHLSTEIEQLRAAVRSAAAYKRAWTEEAIYIARRKAVEREVVGRSITLARSRRAISAEPFFNAPAKRKKEYRSSTGLRSFHFGWSSVTKSSAVRDGSGNRVFAGAAPTHIVYIEDGAVVRDGHTVYIDSSRVETRADGERLVQSNISEHYEERVEFFRLVDQYERVNHGDKVDIDFAVNAAKWAAVVTEPDCDLAVVKAFEAHATGGSSKQQKIALLGSSRDLRKVMAKHGFTFTNPVPNNERLKRDGFCFHDGRGGRTEYRLVFELPREFNREQRAEALTLLCRRFDQAGCMYVAVIHAPDPHNDQDNYHIHLDFYDRKCRRLDGSERDLDNVKASFRPRIAAEMKQGRFRAEVRRGAWDFTVERTYQANKKKKTHRPFGATHKSEALRDRGFVMKVRVGFAEDVNEVACKAGLSEIYDPRDYAAMGINGPRSEKLGSKKHGMETKGVATSVGIENEVAQAAFEERVIEQAYLDSCRHIDEIQLHWQNVARQAPAGMSNERQAVEYELAKARQAIEIRRELDLLALERERERSRARLVSQRQWLASNKGSSAARARSEDLARSADEHIATLDGRDADLVVSIAELEAIATGHDVEQVARAVLDFERTAARFEVERSSSSSSAGTPVSARRNIMIKRGSLQREPDQTASGYKVHPSLADIAEPTQASSPNSFRSLQGDALQAPASSIDTERLAKLSLHEQAIAADGIGAAAPPNSRQVTLSERREDTSQTNEEVPASLLSENASKLTPSTGHGGRVDVASRDQMLGISAPQKNNQPVDAGKGTREAPQPVAGPYSTVQPVAVAMRHMEAPGRPSPEKQDMDPLTAAKLLWAYQELSASEWSAASKADKDLCDQALAHPLADELREALARGKSNCQAAARAKQALVRQQDAAANSVRIAADAKVSEGLDHSLAVKVAVSASPSSCDGLPKQAREELTASEDVVARDLAGARGASGKEPTRGEGHFDRANLSSAGNAPASAGPLAFSSTLR